MTTLLAFHEVDDLDHRLTLVVVTMNPVGPSRVMRRDRSPVSVFSTVL